MFLLQQQGEQFFNGQSCRIPGISGPAQSIFRDLSLSLFVFFVFTNHAHHTAAADNFAMFANLFYGCSDFHYSPHPGHYL